MAVPAMALFAAQRGIETSLAVKGAMDAQVIAKYQSAAIENQMNEIENRTKIQIQQIHQQSDKVVASQQEAFISGGVRLSGSAMSVISDTLNNAAQSAYIRQRETSYELIGSAMEKANYDKMASNETLMLNIGGSMLLGAASLGGDKYKYEQAKTRNVGTTNGLGEV